MSASPAAARCRSSSSPSDKGGRMKLDILEKLQKARAGRVPVALVTDLEINAGIEPALFEAR